MIKQGAYLYGVRFGKETEYVMVETDAGSPYHPGNDPQAVNKMLAALEPLGLVQCVTVQSSDRTPSPHSDRQGIHFYFPFQQAQNSYQIAFAVKACLERAGFKVRDGWLEIFPHPRPYQEGKPALYRGHRLPLQQGSYLLNPDFEPINTTETAFVAQWHHAQHRNAVDSATIEQVSCQIIRKTQFPSASAAKFNADLDAEINLGFTSPGQTNHLVGRVVMKGYIFHHVLTGCSPLEGESLVAYAVETLRSLPGYQEFCGHQHEIEKRVRDYTRAIEASDYYHYDPGKSNRSKRPSNPSATDSPNLPSLNERRSAEAKQRIHNAITDLLTKSTLPAQPTARKRAIVAYGISPQTLDKYRDLWHPSHLQPTPEIDHTPRGEGENSELLKSAQGKQEHTTICNKLVRPLAAPFGHAASTPELGGCGGISTGMDDVANQVACTVAQVQAHLKARASAKQQAIAEAHMTQMQLWLESGDPILVAEAQQVFIAQTQQPDDSHSSLVEIEAEQPSGCLLEDATMPRGFGVAKQKGRETGKAPLKEVQQLNQPSRDLEIEAEIQAAFARHQQEHPEEVALAWSIGVFNPLAGMEDTHARLLTPQEEDWLYTAKAVEWLVVEEDELNAIYFTAPPPDFAMDQADWYVRPDLTTFLDEPMWLSVVVQQYPITLEIIQAAIDQRVDRLGWTSEQLEQFLQKMGFDVPQTQFDQDDWETVLFELQIVEERQ